MKLKTDLSFLVEYTKDFIASVDSSIKKFWPMIYNDDHFKYSINVDEMRDNDELAYIRNMLVDLSDIIDEVRLCNEVFCDEESD